MPWKINNCCGCIPLRIGLFIWGYFCLISTYLTILSKIFQIHDILNGTGRFEPFQFMSVSIKLGAQFVHFIFHVVLVGGLHKKSRGLLETYNGYNVIVMILAGVTFALYVPLSIYSLQLSLNVDIMLLLIAIFVIAMLLQLYITLAVRSYISKLNDDKEDSVSEHLADNHDVPLHLFNRKQNCDNV